eukprot:6208555-Pleurochrysis_carterae.AAC.2
MDCDFPVQAPKRVGTLSRVEGGAGAAHFARLAIALCAARAAEQAAGVCVVFAAASEDVMAFCSPLSDGPVKVSPPLRFRSAANACEWSVCSLHRIDLGKPHFVSPTRVFVSAKACVDAQAVCRCLTTDCTSFSGPG